MASTALKTKCKAYFYDYLLFQKSGSVYLLNGYGIYICHFLEQFSKTFKSYCMKELYILKIRFFSNSNFVWKKGLYYKCIMLKRNIDMYININEEFVVIHAHYY